MPGQSPFETFARHLQMAALCQQNMVGISVGGSLVLEASRVNHMEYRQHLVRTPSTELPVTRNTCGATNGMLTILVIDGVENQRIKGHQVTFNTFKFPIRVKPVFATSLLAVGVATMSLSVNGDAAAADLQHSSVYSTATEASDWTVSFEALYMARYGMDSVPLVVDTGSGSVFLNADEFDDEFGPGFAVSLGHQISPNSHISATFLTLGQDVGTTISAPGAQYTVYGAAFGTDPIDVGYNSDLYSTELNYQHALGSTNLHAIVGVRWIRLIEELNVKDAASPPALNSVDAVNNLIGIQIGVQGTLLTYHGWSLDGAGKIGVFRNEASLNAAFPQAGPAAIFSAGGDQTSYVAEGQIDLRYDVSESLSLKAGYRAMWIDGIALIPEQLDDLAVPLLGQLDDNGSVFYSGFSLGASLRF